MWIAVLAALRQTLTTPDHFRFFHSFTTCVFVDAGCFFLGKVCFSFTFVHLKVIGELSNPEGFDFLTC